MLLHYPRSSFVILNKTWWVTGRLRHFSSAPYAHHAVGVFSTERAEGGVWNSSNAVCRPLTCADGESCALALSRAPHFYFYAHPLTHTTDANLNPNSLTIWQENERGLTQKLTCRCNSQGMHANRIRHTEWAFRLQAGANGPKEFMQCCMRRFLHGWER